MDLKQNKSHYRDLLRDRRADITGQARESKQSEISKNIERLFSELKPTLVASYNSTQSEVDLSAFHKSDFHFAFPKVVGEELQFYVGSVFSMGKFGILEPVPEKCRLTEKSDIDVVLVPAVGFDRLGHRLGYGAGFYDRWLTASSATKVGVAFFEQVLAGSFMSEPHDVPMDYIVTDKFIHKPLMN